jgi:hypothetical protein
MKWIDPSLHRMRCKRSRGGTNLTHRAKKRPLFRRRTAHGW